MTRSTRWISIELSVVGAVYDRAVTDRAYSP